MSIEVQLIERSTSRCELCSANHELAVFDVLPNAGPSVETSVLLCKKCLGQLASTSPVAASHWFGLSESMWSEHAAVKVLVYRVLKGLGNDSWANDLLAQLYLDEDLQTWADAGLTLAVEGKAPVLDSNGTELQDGDTVTLIKDLDVKGANFTAKRGTTVKNISLTDDPKFIEGKINGTRIVLVAAYLKKG